MSEQKEHKGQLEQTLAEIRDKIEELIAEAKSATGGIREDLEEKIEELKGRRDELELTFEQYREKGKDKWEEAKPHLNNALAELKHAMDKFFRKNSN